MSNLIITLLIITYVFAVIYRIYKYIKNKSMVESGVTIVCETVIPSNVDPDGICILSGGRAAGKSLKRFINETEENYIKRVAVKPGSVTIKNITLLEE